MPILKISILDYAFNFLEKVQKVLNENGDDMLFDTLHATLKNFNTETESVPQLYHVIFL